MCHCFCNSVVLSLMPLDGKTEWALCVIFMGSTCLLSPKGLDFISHYTISSGVELIQPLYERLVIIELVAKDEISRKVLCDNSSQLADTCRFSRFVID